MFVSITRQTPKLQQPHVCTSCLSKLLGASDALPLYSNAILSRAPRNIATFSTTRRNNENNQQTENVPEDLKRLKIDPLSKDGSGDNQKTNEASAGSAEAEPGTKSLTKLLEKKKQERKKKPVKAAKPAKPAKTAKPAKPAKPAKSAKSAKPAKPAKSAKQLNQLDGKGKGSQKAALGAEEIIFEDQHKVETESAVRIKRVKQKLINYVNSNCDSPSPSIRHLAVSVEEKKQEKIAPSQLHSIYQSMVAEKGEAAARKDLVDLIQKGGLTTTDRTQVMKELRASLVNRPRPVEGSKSATPSSSTNLAGMLASFESIHNSPVRKVSTKKSKNLEKEKQTSTSKASVSTKGQKAIRTGPIKKSPGTTEFEVKSIDVDSLQLVPVQKKQPPVPGLSYGLERALFNPGVYHLQDPRSRVFNFDPYLQQIMPVNEFDFTALKQYVTSSRDKALIETAKDEKRKYTGSTSSMSASLAHFHFLLSQWRPINTGMLSQEFPVEYNSFTALQRGPSAIFLRERDGVYAIDADKQFDTANILSMLGKSMEKLLTLPKEEFEQYRKENSGSITEDQRNEVESFHYTTMGDFLMRSQLDAHDPRLPGTGMFDLKTRAVISIRMDIDNYAEGSGYEIFNRHGEFESFEREYYDMIRAAFLKYSLQVRMGRMDGIFVAYHNVERIFGFQYISLPEIDNTIHGTTDTTLGDSEFKLSVDLLNKALDRATARFPGKSLRLHFETRGNVETPFMYIFAEPMEEEDIQRIQDTNKAEIEAFESRVLGLHGDKATAEEQLEERKDAEWENLRAKIEESMENDEYEIKSAKEIAESLLEHHDVTGLTLDEVEQRVEEFLSTSSYNEHGEDEAIGENENKLWKEEENVDADEEGDDIIEGGEEIENDADMEKTTADVDEDADEENDDDDIEEEENEEENEEEDEEEEEEDEEEEDDEEAVEKDSEIEVEAVNDDAKTGDLTGIATEESVIQEGLLVDPAEETSEAQQDNDESLDADIREPELVENENVLVDSAEEALDVNETSDEVSNSDESTADESQASKDTDENSDKTLVNDVESTLLEEDKPKEILAMHLAIRNKVNGEYTVRPEHLKASDNWTVEYALSEIPDPEKAMNLYKACQTRRKTALRKSDEPDNKWAEERNNKFIANLKDLARKGRSWRQQTTLKEAGLPIKTLEFREEPKEVGVYEGYEETKKDVEEKNEMANAVEENKE